MPDLEPDHDLDYAIDARPLFLTAVSICAELEYLCGSAGDSLALALVGLARCEITEHDRRLPSALEPHAVESIPDGLRQLELNLNALLAETDHLPSVLRLHEARQLVRDALEATM